MNLVGSIQVISLMPFRFNVIGSPAVTAFKVAVSKLFTSLSVAKLSNLLCITSIPNRL